MVLTEHYLDVQAFCSVLFVLQKCAESHTSLGCALTWTSQFQTSVEYGMEFGLPMVISKLPLMWHNTHWSSRIYSLLVCVFINHWSCFHTVPKAVLYGKIKTLENKTQWSALCSSHFTFFLISILRKQNKKKPAKQTKKIQPAFLALSLKILQLLEKLQQDLQHPCLLIMETL